MAKVVRRELLSELEKIVRIVPNSTTTQIIKGVLVETKDSKMKLSATNLKSSIIISLDCETGMFSDEYVIDARLFHDIVKKINSEVIEITVDENKDINIKSEKSNFQLRPIGNKELFPDIDTIDPKASKKTISITEENFKELVIKTVPFCFDDDTRPILGGVKLEFSKDKALGVSLDGFRLSHKVAIIDNEVETSFVLPASELANVLRAVNGDVKIHFTEESNQKCFAFGNTLIYISELAGQFIDYKQFLQSNYDTKLLINQSSLKDAIERVNIIASSSKKSKPVILEFADNTINISSDNEIGKVSESVKIEECEGELPDCKIAFNSKYLLDGLKVVDCDNVAISVKGSLNPVFLTNETGFTYMVLPIRLAAAS